MGRVGEGFSLARVNQASLIDEPALRAGRGMRVHGPWPPQAMGNGRPRWEEPESWDCTGTWVHNAQAYSPAVAGSRAASSAAIVHYRLRLPCRDQVQSTVGP